MKIFAIVVTYKGMKWYDRCLGSLINSKTPVDIIVIDNASCDGTVEYIKEHYPCVYLVESKENLGFAKGNNMGIRYAIDHGADYVFLLNQDAWVEKNTVAELVKTFDDNEDVGIASPIHLNGSCSGLDYGFVHYVNGTFVSDVYMRTINPYYEIQFVNAAAWMISRRCIETVGGFDTSLFKHYGEDNNYCQRVIFHGFRVVINTTCSICHDREKRKENDNKYLTMKNQMPFFEERIQYADINNPYDLCRMITHIKRIMIRKLFFGKYHAYRTLKQKLACFKQIQASRIINKQVGMNWL